MQKYFVLMAVVLFFSNSNSHAMFAIPTAAPVERLVKNTNLYIKEKPDDPEGHYTLARIHYLAFINKSFSVGTWSTDKLPQITSNFHQRNSLLQARRRHAEQLILKEKGYSSNSDVPKADFKEFWKDVNAKTQELEKNNWKPESLSNIELLGHADAALKSFEKAIDLDDDNALYYLGLASLLEQYIDYIREVKADCLPEQFQKIILEKSKNVYYKAYELSIRKDLKQKHRPLEGLDSLVGYESGNAYLRLMKANGNITRIDEKITAKIEKNIKKLDGLKFGAITPIVFSLKDNKCLADLIDFKKSVMFDLDGNGIAENRNWVKNETGILVWDPENDGIITSGRQMFGSVSWWLFFSDGYRAMDLLDNDRDGQLTGAELKGISGWFDHNSNGISDAGEVLTVKEIGIISIATKAHEYEDGCLMHSAGIRLKDGNTVTTYDWVEEGKLIKRNRYE